MSSTIRKTPRFSRRRFVSASVVALLVSSSQLRGELSRRRVSFGVFSLFEPSELILQSTDSLSLQLEDRRFILARDASALRIRWLENRRMAIDINGQAMAASHFSATALSGGTTRFTLAIEPSAKHGGIRREFQGALEVRALASCLVPTVSMDVETAVASIVSAESPPGAPQQFLMAQAIASRSFLVAAHTAHGGFDFCDTTHCQYLRGPVVAGSPASVAAACTAGLYLTYGASSLGGHPIAAMYCRSCSGRTSSLGELGLPEGDYPYYAVDCEFCRHHPEIWERTFEGPLKPGSERERLAFDRIHGWSAIPSSSFSQNQKRIEGRGIGHGLGLCQRGAEAMARQGAGFSEILEHYYPNTEIASA
jgi:peptidoglycan hydrolase-like amidase